jgi:hypothetical protein
MQTHSAFKNYKCKRCHKSFALKSYLNKHYESACFKDLPLPAIDTPPSTPSPPSSDDSCGPPLSLDLNYSEPPASPPTTAATSVTPAEANAAVATANGTLATHRHVIHIPTPVFPYSGHLIKV